MAPGDLITPSKKVYYKGGGTLVVWKSLEGFADEQSDVVEMNELMVVLEVCSYKKDYPAEGWDKSVRVLTPRGNVGWVGSGWIRKLSPPAPDR